MLGVGLGSVAQRTFPRWWPNGAAFAFDFTLGEAVVAGKRLSAAGLLICQRASPATAPQQSGSLLTFAANQPRITNRGLLVEDGRTNLLNNSFSPVQQSLPLPAGTYAVSMLGGGQIEVSGAVEGVATQEASLIVSLPESGITTVTPQDDVTFFQLEPGGFATSPIATEDAAAIRGDEAVILTDPALFDLPSCTVLVEWEQVASGEIATNDVQTLLRWDTVGGVWSRIRSGSTVIAQVSDTDGELILNAGSGVTAPSGVHRVALALAPDDMAIAWSASVDGTGDIRSDTSGVPATNIAGLRLGGAEASERLNGWIRKIAYWPERLANDNLVSFCQEQA